MGKFDLENLFWEILVCNKLEALKLTRVSNIFSGLNLKMCQLMLPMKKILKMQQSKIHDQYCHHFLCIYSFFRVI